MLPVQILPMNNAFMVEHPVAQITNAGESGVEFSHISLRPRRLCEGLRRQCVTNTVSCVMFVHETGPKSEVQFGDHSTGGSWLDIFPESALGGINLLLLPG